MDLIVLTDGKSVSWMSAEGSMVSWWRWMGEWWIDGGEIKAREWRDDDVVIEGWLRMKEWWWRTVWEARWNTFFNEFTDKLITSYMWVCDTQYVCLYMCVWDASTHHHGSGVSPHQSAVRNIQTERISNIYQVVKLLLLLLIISSSSLLLLLFLHGGSPPLPSLCVSPPAVSSSSLLSSVLPLQLFPVVSSSTH